MEIHTNKYGKFREKYISNCFAIIMINFRELNSFFLEFFENGSPAINTHNRNTLILSQNQRKMKSSNVNVPKIINSDSKAPGVYFYSEKLNTIRFLN